MAEAYILNFGFPFLLIFARVAAFVSILPFWSWRGIPVVLRILFALMLAVTLTFSWEGQLILPFQAGEFIFLLGREILVGLVLGFLVYLFLSAFLMAGQFMDHQAGLMMAGTFDPLFSGQVTLLGRFAYFLAVVFYLSINGHHFLFLSLRESFTVIPLMGTAISSPVIRHYLRTCGAVFLLAFQIAAPVIIVLWLLDIALGLLSKAVPQIHVFIVGLPLKVALVLLVFLLLLPLLGGVMEDVFSLLAKDFMLIMENWAG
ncbi:MAG: flagellar biosynthetic protein FliR [Firmicutes bacterium]|mgnify:CR=1 FL=1|nr:flagellar biosynthetic protein FliR [Bacillota bacterium]